MIPNDKNIFNLLAETISEALLIVDKNQRIIIVNDTLCELFLYAKEELIGKNLEILIPTNYRAHHSTHVENFVMESKKRIMGHGRSLFGLKKDGSQFPIEVGLKPFNVRGYTFVLGLVMDVTQRKLYEEKIIEINKQLEEKVVERTTVLEQTINTLEKEIIKRKKAENKIKESLKKERDLNELKTKFLSLVSHEFKTPLSGILTSTTLIGKYTSETQQDKREKHINTINSKVKYLNNILDDFLSVERLENGKVNYKSTKFPLSKVLNEVIYNANMLLKEGQSINYPENIDLIQLIFDEKVLELVLTNLISNAIKYAPEHTVINIKVILKKEDLYIKVIDQGIGIPEKEQKFIFNRYFRAENALLNQGTGIGLNIAKSHLENLGAALTFESIENKGSTFTLKIPLQS